MLMLISMPFIGALIGWLTNYLAVRMLFRPLRPVRIPLIHLTVQGLIPRRKVELSRSIGEIVQRELVTPEDIVGLLAPSGAGDDMIAKISRVIEDRIRLRLPVILPATVRSAIARYVADLVRAEAREALGPVSENLRESIRGGLNVAGLVEGKISCLSDEELERLVLRVASRELRHIIVLGAVIGFLIGLAQVGFGWLGL